VSFQNSQHITSIRDGDPDFRHRSGIYPCINAATAPAYCVGTNLNAVVANNVVRTAPSTHRRAGDSYWAAVRDGDTDANVASDDRSKYVVEGYGRTVPASFGIGRAWATTISTRTTTSTTATTADLNLAEHRGNDRANGVATAHTSPSISLESAARDHEHGGSIRIDAKLCLTAPGNKILSNGFTT